VQKRRAEESFEAERSARPRAERTRDAADHVLGLQRAAGNAAVSRLLRSPLDVPVEEQPVPLEGTTTYTMKLGKIGPFPIESFSFQVDKRPPRAREDKEEPRAT
jgi:hypothetical protein